MQPIFHVRQTLLEDLPGAVPVPHSQVGFDPFPVPVRTGHTRIWPRSRLISIRSCSLGSTDWQSFLKANQLVGSMSLRGNCHDNAVAESFFQLLKRERSRLRIYLTREAARSDVFDYIESFYNPRRRHGTSDDLSPVECGRRYLQSLTDV